MKYSLIFWLILIITACILCNIFPIIKHDPLTYLLFVYVITRFWKYILFRRVPKKYRFATDDVAIITGSSSGIGCQIAQHLCSRGSKVIWAARDTRKAQNALNDIIWTPDHGIRGYVLHVDLASMKSIEQFVKEFKKRGSVLNLLVLNAAYHGPYRLTVDGFEQTIGVNHLGHMYLCYLLMDLLKSCSPSRIVVVSSDLSILCKKVRLDDLMYAKKDSYSSWAAYNHSKLLNLLFVKELSRRLKGTGVTVHAAHPGTPVATELMRDSVLATVIIDQFIFRPLSFFYCRTPSEAAQTPLYAALAPEFAENTGLYFENCRAVKMNSIAMDEKIASQLWDQSCKLLNIKKNWL